MTMPLDTGDVIGILGDNLRLRKSVLPLPAKVATKWTEGLGLRRGGDTVLYTGMMYQLIPYIEGLVKAELKMGDSWMGKYTGLGRKVNRVVQFGALFEDDLYSGALAFDLGLDEVVVEHARKVHAVFKKYGVKTVITIDPHTTTMLRSTYPKILEGYDVEVKSYLEVLAETGFGINGHDAKRLEGEVVLHDSCVFARYEGVVDEPRELLAAAGLTLRDPENSGRQTWCCGGPVESLYPIKAAANAQNRVAQLRAAAPDAVTMCPMCFVNLSNAAGSTMRFKDISEYLREAYTS
jgi:Fe-S oxidoreductase